MRSRIESWIPNIVSTTFIPGFKKTLSERTTKIYGTFLLLIFGLALLGDNIAPYEYNERHRGPDGELLRAEGPSWSHPLGTTDQGYDLLSMMLVGTQPTVVSGIIGGTLVITIGLTIGLTSGYVGGRLDDLLMRITDTVYGIPLIPFALVLIAFFGVGFFQSILVIGLVLWRGSARVIRSQTLQIKERPFIVSAKATGASTPRIMIKHILPNVAPMAVLFFALNTGSVIIIMAGLAFIGVTDPFVPSWGIIIRNAYNSGVMTHNWMWPVAPGLMISFTVLSLFMFGRGYEAVSSQESVSDEAISETGGG